MEPGLFQITLKVFLVNEQNQLLILRDAQSGTGDLPGGRMGQKEIYQPWEEQVSRELREELGTHVQYHLHPEPIFVFPHWMLADKCEALGIAFRAEYLSGDIQLSAEHDQLAWEDISAYDPSRAFPEQFAKAVRRFQADFL